MKKEVIMSLRMKLLVLQQRLKRKTERRIDMRNTYFYADGNVLYSCEYETIGEVEWKIVGTDKKVRVCENSESAEREMKKLNNGDR